MKGGDKKMLKKAAGFIAVSALVFSAGLGFSASKVSAGNNYDFTGNNGYNNSVSCPDVGGNVVASYSDGNHAIAGYTNQFYGSDVVYSIGNNNYIQCYCPPANSGSSTGIQSNWYRVDGNMSDSVMQQYVNSGWVFIQNGADWGLPGGSYLVKNIQFDCQNNCGQTQSSDQNQYNNQYNNHINYFKPFPGKGNAYGLMKKMFRFGNSYQNKNMVNGYYHD